jgi:hypothetical protein
MFKTEYSTEIYSKHFVATVYLNQLFSPSLFLGVLKPLSIITET